MLKGWEALCSFCVIVALLMHCFKVDLKSLSKKEMDDRKRV